jgi:hypothetical protein
MSRKGSIPWQNFCLRKYGGSIRREIYRAALNATARPRAVRDVAEAQEDVRRDNEKAAAFMELLIARGRKETEH